MNESNHVISHTQKWNRKLEKKLTLKQLVYVFASKKKKKGQLRAAIFHLGKECHENKSPSLVPKKLPQLVDDLPYQLKQLAIHDSQKLSDLWSVMVI